MSDQFHLYEGFICFSEYVLLKSRLETSHFNCLLKQSIHLLENVIFLYIKKSNFKTLHSLHLFLITQSNK